MQTHINSFLASLGFHVTVSGKTPDALFEQAAGISGDPLFGFHCALALPVSPRGPFLSTLAGLGWNTGAVTTELELRQGGCSTQANQFFVTRLVKLARECVGESINPRAVWFAHQGEASPEFLSWLKADRVEFGRKSIGVVLEVAKLEVEEREREQVFIARVREVILSLLPEGHGSIAYTARGLFMSRRTLQRRLEDYGTTFAAELASVRRARAEQILVHTPMPVGEVATQVGYRNAAAFVRAFRTWAGITPGSYRHAAPPAFTVQPPRPSHPPRVIARPAMKNAVAVSAAAMSVSL